ncbi:hypothetical protein vseg_013905 [Gypsophila vaccaria]
MTNILELPDDCLARILSLTSPEDVLRSSVVSKQFLSASKSDTVWAKFLSSAYNVSRPFSSKPYDEFVTKKSIYLCRFPILLENDTMSYGYDKWSRRVCYTLGARTLSFSEGSRHGIWRWESEEGSCFSECAVMESFFWLEIKGKIRTELLTPDTTYGAYLVYRIRASEYASLFGHVPMAVSISEVSEDGTSTSDHKIRNLFKKKKKNVNDHWTPEQKRCYLNTPDDPSNRAEILPVFRSDGWMEIEMGRHRVGVQGEYQNVALEMTIKDCVGGHRRTGLVVHGIEVRPLHVTRKQQMYDQLTRQLVSKMKSRNSFRSE